MNSAAEQNAALKRSSVAIGQKNYRQNNMSEAAQQFAPPQVNTYAKNANMAEEKEMINNLKGHHFDFGR